MKRQLFEVILPFSGFYNSIHDSELDSALDLMASDSATGCYINQGLRDRLFDCLDWSAVHSDYAKCYAEALAYEYTLEINFIRLISPKYYNYETDRILASIDRATLAKLASVRKSEAFTMLCKERFTSCSGFISHYRPDPREWPSKLTDWDHNQIGALLEAYILAGDHSGNSSDDWELSLLGSGNLYEDAYRCIDNNFTETENTRRVLKVWNYLREREERV